MKWKRYQLIGMGAGALVFATVAGVSFLLGTSAGLRVLSSGAEWAVDGLKVGDVSGSLLHLRLSDVRYEAPGIRFKADRFSYDVAGLLEPHRRGRRSSGRRRDRRAHEGASSLGRDV